MRYGIFSDVHANLEAFEAVIGAYRREAVDKYICVGDVVGYGANPKECIQSLKAMSAITVAGNHDCASVDLFSLEFFNPMAAQAIKWTRKQLGLKERDFLASLKLEFRFKDLIFVHGTLDAPQEFNYMINNYFALRTFKAMDARVCFVGHSHIPGTFIMDKNSDLRYTSNDKIEIKNDFKYIVNVGSVGQPRDENPYAAYCIYDSDKNEINIKRIEYNIALARKKILDAGLPHFLGDRLVWGK